MSLRRIGRDFLTAAAKTVSQGDAVKPERLVSLDLLRGIAVMGMILVNEMAGMAGEGPVYPTLLHARWDGLTVADWVFPAFLMMVGVSIPLARSARQAVSSDAHEVSRVLWRSARLILLGFVLTNLWWLADFEASSWRLFGVLQRIGLVYAACALLFLWMGARARLITAAAVLLIYWPLTLIPSLDGLPNDIWLRGHNFVASVDRLLLGEHLYVKGPQGYDPEGLVSTLPAIAQGLIGVAIGEYLLRRGDAKTRGLFLAGTAMLIGGVAWGLLFPIIKDIWSSSFVLVTCGITTLLLAFLHALFDNQPISGVRRAIAVLILPFGVNAIAAYVLHILASSLLGWDLLQEPYRLARPVMGPEAAALIPVLLFLGFIWLCMFYLWRRRWIIKI